MADLFKRISDGILSRNPDADDQSQESPDSEGLDQEQPEYGLEDCAHDILSAIKANDPYMLADALREAFQKLQSGEAEPESMPEMPQGEE